MEITESAVKPVKTTEKGKISSPKKVSTNVKR